MERRWFRQSIWLCLSSPSVKKLIYFSTVSSYGAFPENKIDYFLPKKTLFARVSIFTPRKNVLLRNYWGSVMKKIANNQNKPEVAIIRPAAITGPRGRYARIRFGLQAALSGRLKNKGHFFMILFHSGFLGCRWPRKWLRQYVHEDDITDIVALLAFSPLKQRYEVFNIAPSGGVVFGNDMAEAVGKRTLPVHPWMVRFTFFDVALDSGFSFQHQKGSWKG